MAKKKYTKEQMEFMIKRLGSDASIARYLKVSRQSVQKQRSSLGIPSRLSGILDRNKRIVKMYQEDIDVSRIVAITNMSLTHVKKIINDWRANSEIS